MEGDTRYLDADFDGLSDSLEMAEESSDECDSPEYSESGEDDAQGHHQDEEDAEFELDRLKALSGFQTSPQNSL